MTAVVLRPLQSVSPSLAEALGSCRLRAGLHSEPESRQYVLGNPKGWLGTAYHLVIEASAKGQLGSANEPDVNRLWDATIAKQIAQNAGHPLDQRWGAAETWPGYNLAKALVLIRAKEVARSNVSSRSIGRSPLRETKLSAFEGRLVGRPDYASDDVILDFKTGKLTEWSDEIGSDVIKGSYIRQMQIYAYLYHAERGVWPKRAVLVPNVGSQLEISILPHECVAEAERVISLLDGYNAVIRNSFDVAGLASPSATACKWCPFKCLCPAFWQQVRPSWHESLGCAALQGQLMRIQRVTFDDSVANLSVAVTAGTESSQEVQIVQASRGIIGPSCEIGTGDELRCTGALRRPDGSLTATRSTLIFDVRALPEIRICTYPGPAQVSESEKRK